MSIMSVNHFSIDVPLHGGLYHSTCIMICKYVCWKRGYKIKNPEGFASLYKTPGIPDIYISYQYKGKDDRNQTRTLEKSVCIEIETNPSEASILKKTEQFTRPGMGEPIIIDVIKGFQDYKEKQISKRKTFPNDIEWMADYIESVLIL
jgi:hypothetical protein